MSCEHCVKGVRHEGTPEGTFEEIAGVKCYVSTPTGEYDKSKVVLYLTDAFGLELVNNLLLADDFARNGFKVVAPDFFEGDPLPADLLDNVSQSEGFDFIVWGKENNFDLMGWAGRHSPPYNTTRVKGVIDALKADGVARTATTGYCYGGRMAFNFAFAGVTDVTAVSHPSMIQVEDLEKYAAGVKAPLLINACEQDFQHTKEKQQKAAEILKDFAPGFRQAYFEGCEHGFAVRGDLSNPKVKAGKEGSFKNTVEWFNKYL